MTGAGGVNDSLTRWPRLCAFTAGARPRRTRVIGPLTLASRDCRHRGLRTVAASRLNYALWGRFRIAPVIASLRKDTPATVTVDRSKEADMADVFISYSQKRRDLTENLAAALQGFGYEVWWDRSSLEGGQRFDDEIRQALDEAGAVIVVWTPESATSRYVLMEAGIAYGWSKLITSHSPEFDKGLIPKPFIGLNSIPVTDLGKVRSALDALKVKPTGAMERALRKLDEHDPGVREGFEAWKIKCERTGMFVRAHPTRTLTVRCYVGKKDINLASISDATLKIADFCIQRIATENPDATETYMQGLKGLLPGTTLLRNEQGQPINLRSGDALPPLRKLLARGDEWIALMGDVRRQFVGAGSLPHAQS
jgi:TIR domain